MVEKISFLHGQTYTQSNTSNVLNTLITKINTIENDLGGSKNASQLAKSYNSIFLTQEQMEEGKRKNISEETQKSEALKNFNRLSGKNLGSYNEIAEYEEDVLKYYEYIQFKRAVFNCTGLQYDNTTSRVNEMEFTFTGKIH